MDSTDNNNNNNVNSNDVRVTNMNVMNKRSFENSKRNPDSFGQAFGQEFSKYKNCFWFFICDLQTTLIGRDDNDVVVCDPYRHYSLECTTELIRITSNIIQFN